MLDVIMLDTILLCGNTKDDREHDQPSGVVDLGVSETQWAWLEKQLASSV